LIRSIREQNGFPIYLNADHTHSIESRGGPQSARLA
jgi:hypothetical protein